mgnify:CR=1 FL=1
MDADRRKPRQDNYKGNIKYNEKLEFKLLKTEPCWVYNYQQYTKNATTGAPMHAENGFWKFFPPNEKGHMHVEASYSHSFSLNVFEKGKLGRDSETGMLSLLTVADKPHHFQRSTMTETAKETGKKAAGCKRQYMIDEKKGKLMHQFSLKTEEDLYWNRHLRSVLG